MFRSKWCLNTYFLTQFSFKSYTYNLLRRYCLHRDANHCSVFAIDVTLAVHSIFCPFSVQHHFCSIFTYQSEITLIYHFSLPILFYFSTHFTYITGQKWLEQITLHRNVFEDLQFSICKFILIKHITHANSKIDFLTINIILLPHLGLVSLFHHLHHSDLGYLKYYIIVDFIQMLFVTALTWVWKIKISIE